MIKTFLPLIFNKVVPSDQGSNNESVEFDFVNLPGYGVIDDFNSTKQNNFTCYERRYGYYADTYKGCSMFHLCYPTRDPQSEEITYQRFSFVCSENGVFDQQNLVCVENGTASIPCEESEQIYDSSNVRLYESLQQNAPGFFAEASDAKSNVESGEAQESVIHERFIHPGFESWEQ
ncbi:uncharacterized protein B4U79_02195 [Dinothrombium tinctorium]|uniref:Chitin-binding type-2 domain-containing protein n=1 Tax=Dinothrombium tinctorium TaxID=1965070 RepID=A0A443RDK5_9ACAR|nr:uncharacterized protein B4U79_02195 [Dinothrombium tinctorium]